MKHFFLLIAFTAIIYIGNAQSQIGFTLPPGKKSVQIVFERLNNLIVIPVRINNFITLKFILDTGAESVILTERIFADVLELNYVRSLQITGPGLIDSVEAHVVTNVNLYLSGGVRGLGMSMLVLEEDYLELKKNLGDDIYGILGYEIFNRFIVDIDYDDNLITLHDPKYFKPKRKFKEFELSITDTKPYLLSYFRQNNKEIPIRLMIDTGASHALLLDVSKTNDLVVPDNTISARLGQGIGGEIPGQIGRIEKYRIGDFDFKDVLVSIPDNGAYSSVIKRGSRHGTLGGEILRRFQVVFDYPNNKIYLQKNHTFKDKFDYDMSGLSIGVTPETLDSILVMNVRENSPAEKAGIQQGDILLHVNGRTLENATLGDIIVMLRKNEKYKIRTKIFRNNQEIRKEFRLVKAV